MTRVQKLFEAECERFGHVVLKVDSWKNPAELRFIFDGGEDFAVCMLSEPRIRALHSALDTWLSQPPK